MYRLHADGCLAPVLAGRRILLVGGCQAEGWAGRMSDAGWRARNGLSFEVAGHMAVPPRATRPKSPHFGRIAGEMGRAEWDIALVAAGGLALPLCHFALSLGRSALDCGALDRQVMGETRRGSGGFVA